MARGTFDVQPETVSRTRIATVVALPLLLLLAALTIGDFFRLRASTAARFNQRIEDEAVQCADVMAARVRAVRQSVAFMTEFAREAARLGDREIEAVLAAHVRSHPDLLGAGIGFADGARPPLAFGPEPPSPLSRCATMPGSVGTQIRYAPVVVRSATTGALCLVNLLPGVASGSGTANPMTPIAPVPDSLKYLADVAGSPGMLWVGAAVHGTELDAGAAALTVLELINPETLLAAKLPAGSRATLALILDTTGWEAGGGGTVVLEAAAADGTVVAQGRRIEVPMATAAIGAVGRAAGDKGSATGPVSVRLDGISYLIATSEIPFPVGETHLRPLRVAFLAPVPDLLREVYRELSDRVFFGVVVVTLIVVFATAIGPTLLAPLRRLARSKDRLELHTHERDKSRVPSVSEALRDAQSPLAEAAADLSVLANAEISGSTDNTIARSIQSALLTTVFPKRPEFDLFAQTAPALRVGGDCYDFFPTGPQTLGVMIADVAGKGFAAAMFMSATRTLIREVVSQGMPSPAAVLGRVNKMLLATSPEMLFVTTFLGNYNIKTGVLTYASAGHPPPLIFSGDSRTSRRLARATGTVMGAIDNVRYEDREALLAKGERLVLYTDGVSEARAKTSREFFGEHGLAELCARHPELRAEFLCHEIIAEIERMEGDARSDDATVLVLRRLM